MIELADYLMQLSAAAAGFCAALRRYLRCRRQPWFLLACFYGTFALGTLYWTLHLLLRQETPQIIYVSDLAWTASFVFLLTLAFTLSGPEERRFRFCSALPRGRGERRHAGGAGGGGDHEAAAAGLLPADIRAEGG